MPGSPLGIVWGVFVIMATMLVMSLCIIASVVIHGKRRRESESKFRVVFNGATDANILSHNENRIIDANDSACDLLGYSKAELRKASFDGLAPDGKWKRFLRDIRAVVESGVDQRGESELKCKDGSTVLVEFGSTRMIVEEDAYILWCFRDVTERKRAEEALREGEERYRAVWQYSPVGICLTDEDGIYHHANPAYCGIYGYAEEELVGRPYYELIMKPEEFEGRRERYNMLFEEGTPIPLGETRFVRKDGKRIWIQYTGDFVRRDGKPVFMVSLNIDITEKKEIRELLLEERRILEEKNAALHEVLSHIEEEKSKFRNEVTEAVDGILMTLLHRSANDDGTVNRAYFDLLEKHLRELATPGSGIGRAFSKLSPREIEICTLIRHGATSKEISKTLNLSLFTVNKHRQRIRRKLVIRNKEVNLTTYLRNLESS